MLSKVGNLTLSNSIKRRFFSASSLDELLRRPILERSNADPDTLQDLDAFPVPILGDQVSEALRVEFAKPLTCRTDWSSAPSALEQVNGDYGRAARLIHVTLATWRNRPGNPVEPDYTESSSCLRPARGIQDPDKTRTWIQQECAKMYEEIASGRADRYEAPESLIPAAEDLELSAEQRKMLQPALIAVGRAYKLHPSIKKEIIGHICSVLTKSS